MREWSWNMIKAVIFDLDDTLTPEMQYVESGYRHVASVLEELILSVRGEAVLTKEEIFTRLMLLFRENNKRVFNRLFESYHLKFELMDVQALVEEYRNHEPDIFYYKEVKEVLLQLRQKKMKLGIITDGPAMAQKKKLEALEAFQDFDKIIVTDELGRDYWKPNGKSFQLMARDLGVDYREMVYVGDNPEKDFYIQKIYPIHTVRVEREEGVYKNSLYLEGVREMYKISSLDKLPELLSHME